MKKIYMLFLLVFAMIETNAQNDCATAVPITSIPYSSGSLTTCGTGDDYVAGDFYTTLYGDGEDYVFSLNITAPVTYYIALGGTAVWKILSVHSACPPSSTNAIGGLTTSTGTSASGSITFPAAGTYYLIVDTWPTPDCGGFTLDITIPPPPPANDEATGAVPLTVNADLACTIETAGTTVSATLSADAGPTCSSTGINDDVWFSFVATSSAQTISFSNVSTGTMAAALYTGTPGSLSFVTGACASTSLTAFGLSIGTTYYVRAYTTTATASTAATFDICVGTPPPPPANDECSGAILLSVNSDLNCAVVTLGSTEGSTASVTVPSCFVNSFDDDVWFKFVATNSSHPITITSVSGSTDRVTEVYSGTCAGLVSVACSDPENFTVSGLTIGNTYFVRVSSYNFSLPSTTRTTFNICIGTPPPPPANDDCSGATALTVNPDLNCGTVTQGTTISATETSGEEDPTCGPTGVNDDVWYTFIATNTSHRVTITNISGATDMAVQVYSGSCGSLTTLTCSDPQDFTLTGLTINDTYTLRVYTYTSTPATRSTFNICIGTPPPMSYISSTTTQSSSATVTAGTVNQQIVRLQVIVNGTNAPVLNMSQIDINTGASTNAAVDIDSVKIYYTGTSTTFSTANQFGTAVANPNGPVSFTGSQNLTATGSSNTSNYFWVVYNIACAATATNVVDAQVTAFNIGTSQIPTVTDPTGTRAIAAATSTAVTSQPSTSTIIGGTANNQILRVALTGCSGSVVSQINFNTIGSTNAATDISAARVFYTTNTTFATTTQFGADVVAPNGAFSVNGSQILTTGTGYFWLVYDIPASATDANVVDAANESAVVAGNSLIPTTTNPTGTRTIIAPLVNDNAPGAITLTLGAGCPGTYFTLVNASQALNEPTGSCSDITGYATVWFKFVAPASGAVRISTDEGTGNTLTDSRVALFSATDVNDYGTFSILSCDEDGGSVLGSGYMSVLFSTGLIAGNTYYIQVDKYIASTTAGTFCLTVDELNASMLSTTTDCTAGQALVGNQASYTGWASIISSDSKLIAMVRNPTGGSVNSYSNAQNIHTGAVRVSDDGTPYLDRNVRINNTSATNVEVQFFFLASELAALNAIDGTTLSTMGVSHQTGSTCTTDFSEAGGIPIVLPQTGNGTTADGLVNWVSVVTPSFSNFFLHKAATVLPISLNYFNGAKQSASKNLLNWKLACSGNNISIVLERSANQQDYAAIHSAVISNSSDCNLPFSFLDNAANAGVNYYRLKMVDADGRTSYSNIVALVNGSRAFDMVSLAPNPVRNTTTITIASADVAKLNLKLTDIAGRQISTQSFMLHAGENKISLDFSKLASGTYTITGVSSDGSIQNVRFVKQ